MKNGMMTGLRASAVTLALMLGVALAEEGAVAPKAAPQPAAAAAVNEENTTAINERNQVSRLRGKLLYKKGQIRKMEKLAQESNGGLKKKLEALEKQRRELLVAADPKLGPLYEEQDKLEAEITETVMKGIKMK